MNLFSNVFSKLNRRQWQLVTLIAGTITLMMVTTGCTANWITEAQQIITTITTIVSSIVATLGLFGVAVSPAVTNEITQVATDVDAELTTVGTLITEYQATPSTTILGKIQAALTAAQQNLTTILTNAQITNPAIQTKIAAIVTLAINTVKELVALLPSTTTTAAEHISVTGTVTKLKDYFDKAPVKALKHNYNTILDTPTGDAEVDATFAKVKRL